MKRIIIAIDGPSGAGKSTVARAVAARLGYTYIDTGAMYRAVALLGIESGIPLEDEAGTIALTEQMDLRFEPGECDSQRVIVNGQDVTADLRSPEVTRLSSPASAISGVRRLLVSLHQRMGAGGGVVMVGSDIGTVVYPNADLKVFLTASEQERALRRWRERQAVGDTVTVEQILQQQRERDLRDSSRADSPLAAAPDAITVESDGMTKDEVVDFILDAAKQRGACLT
jgi:cytidylate kinase